ETLAERAPEVGLERSHRDVAAVAGLVDRVAGMASGEHRVAVRGLFPLEQIAEHVHDLPGDRAVHHGDVDHLAAPGLLARPEGGEDAHRCHQGTAPDVGDLHPGDGRRTSRRAGASDDAREAEAVYGLPPAIATTP